MTRRLIICCDGTWNKPDQLDDGVRAPTNVSKLALGISGEGSGGVPQHLFYQRGVGTGKFQRLRGGAFGYGLSRNVRECYRFLVENYQPGDELYFFGFSRGAYTARSTVGFINNCGILRYDNRDRIDEAYSLYRSRSEQDHPRTIESRLFRRTYSHDEIAIEFIGVWDTVGALGIPIDGLRVPFLDRYRGFHDTALSGRVRSAYHALAIDEQRGPFKPALWQKRDRPEDQPLKQVWFAGVHTDVGGGQSDPALSEITLLWMVKCANDRGLEFEPDHFAITAVPELQARALGEQLAPDALGPIHESRKGLYKLMPRHVRRLADEAGQSAASSAVSRLQRPDYGPENLEAWVAAKGDVSTVEEGSPPTDQPS